MTLPEMAIKTHGSARAALLAEDTTKWPLGDEMKLWRAVLKELAEQDRARGPIELL